MSKRPPRARPARRAGAAAAATVDATPAFASAADRPRPGIEVPRGQWLTRLALALAVVLVVARLPMSETVRAPGTVSPGSPAVPAGPGPAAGLLLDLLAGLCPLLVLARRCLDPTFALRPTASAALFLCLGGWAVVSPLWADDKFAAVVSASHLLAAGAVLWAVAQSARDRRDLWPATGLCAGLLAVLLAHGVWYHFDDRQALIAEFERDPATVARVQNVQPGTFAYTQLVNSILHGELRGFSVSANTYGATLTLLGLVTLGALAECARQRRWAGVAVAGALLAAHALVLPLTQSKTAQSTYGLGVALVAAFVGLAAWSRTAGRFDALLRRRATAVYVLGVVGVLGAAAFVVGYGVSHGTLFQDSLNFRWRYWTASADLWRLHPWVGVGWENFGYHYLGVRIPEATEEIKDPHNFLVRFATELGLVGGVLAVAWVARAGWELTRPAATTATAAAATADAGGSPDDTTGTADPDPADAAAATRAGDPADDGGERAGRPSTPAATLSAFALPLAVGALVNVLAAVDVSVDASYAQSEIAKRCVYLIALLAVAAPLALRLAKVNDRGELAFARATSPAPAVRVGLLVGLGMFFVHNLVDFAMFEVGPMFLMAFLLGTALGTRPRPAALAVATGQASGRGEERGARGRRVARLAVAVFGAGWLLAAVLVVGPVVAAEAVADRADDALRLRQARPAALALEKAFGETVRNADYAARAARAWGWAGDPARAKADYDAAVAANPADASLLVERAGLLAALNPPDVAGALADYDRAVRLDPISRANRLQYAALLERAGRPAEALAQYTTALELNERLTKEEKRRLTPAEVAATSAAIARLTPDRQGR